MSPHTRSPSVKCVNTRHNGGTETFQTTEAQKDLMKYIILTQALRGSLEVAGFSNQFRLFSNLLGKIAVLILFERYISHVAQAGTTSPLVGETFSNTSDIYS